MNGAQIIPGMAENAFYADGSGAVVQYPTVNGCLFEPIKCTNGLTVSYWVRELPNVRSFAVYFHTGACQGMSIGVCFGVLSDAYFFQIRTGVYTRVYRMPPLPFEQWHHITFRWEERDIALYVNGLNGYKYKLQEGGKSYTSNLLKPLSIGSGGFDPTPISPATIMIDEVNIWYEKLDYNEIWMLYMQGGKVKLWEMR